MVKVDDATYVAMRDNLYKWDAAVASRAKAKIESSYTDEQYNDFVTKLGNIWTQRAEVSNPTPQTTTPTAQPTEQATQQPTQTAPEVKQETEIKQAETTGSTVPEIKQEWALKPLSQDYYNQTSDDAQSKIISNLNNYRQTNPEYFRDYESFKKNFSYDARNDEQKQTLDSWYGGYQKWMELAWIPVTDLYTQYKDGQVSMNELENLRIYDPTKYAELQAQINKWNIIAAYDDDKWVETTWLTLQDMAYNAAVQMFTKFLSGDSSSGASQYFRDYEEKMESPEMLALSDQCTEVQEQMENIQSDLDSIKKSVEAEYEWTWATRSKINAIIADRSYDLQLQLRTLNSEYNKYATQYNNRMQQYQNEFNMQIQEYQINQQARQQQMNELWFAMDLMNFETNDQKQQREWDYWVKQQEYTNWNINSKDYDTRYKAALKSVQNLLSQYEGIPMQRSAEQMAQDVLKAIDNGSDLGTELTKINKQIQGKPEYKYLYNQTFKPATSSGFWKTVTIWGVTYQEYNWKLYTAEEFNSQFWGKGKAYNSVSSETMSEWFGKFTDNLNSKYTNWYWWQCWAFVNDYLQSLWMDRYYDNNLTTKLNSVNTSSPTIWSIAVFDYNHKSEDWVNYWHVGIVADITQSWDLIILDSNFGSDWKIQYRTVNPNSASLKWFFDPTIPYGWVSSSVSETTNADWTTTVTSTMTVWNMTSKQFDDYVKQYIDWEINYTEVKAAFWDEWLAKVTERAAQLKEQGYRKSTKITDPAKQSSLEEKLRKEYDKSVSDAQETIDWVNKMEEAYNLIDSNKNAASQAIVIAYNKILDPGSVVREWEYARSAEWQSLLKQMEAKLQKLSKWWAWLTKEELKSLLDVAKKFSQNAEKTQEEAAQRTKVSIDKYWLTPEAVLPSDVVERLYWTSTTSWSSTWKRFFTRNTASSSSNYTNDYWSEYWSDYQSNTPAWQATIDVGNGLTIQRD